jgi:hypothetical protein
LCAELLFLFLISVLIQQGIFFYKKWILATKAPRH